MTSTGARRTTATSTGCGRTTVGPCGDGFVALPCRVLLVGAFSHSCVLCCRPLLPPVAARASSGPPGPYSPTAERWLAIGSRALPVGLGALDRCGHRPVWHTGGEEVNSTKEPPSNASAHSEPWCFWRLSAGCSEGSPSFGPAPAAQQRTRATPSHKHWPWRGFGCIVSDVLSLGTLTGRSNDML